MSEFASENIINSGDISRAGNFLQHTWTSQSSSFRIAPCFVDGEIEVHMSEYK